MATRQQKEKSSIRLLTPEDKRCCKCTLCKSIDPKIYKILVEISLLDTTHDDKKQ